jgi:hypothetical protein
LGELVGPKQTPEASKQATNQPTNQPTLIFLSKPLPKTQKNKIINMGDQW